jgi:hypothetical protein
MVERWCWPWVSLAPAMSAAEAAAGQIAVMVIVGDEGYVDRVCSWYPLWYLIETWQDCWSLSAYVRIQNDRDLVGSTAERVRCERRRVQWTGLPLNLIVSPGWAAGNALVDQVLAAIGRQEG